MPIKPIRTESAQAWAQTQVCIHLRGTPMPIKPIRTESAQAWAQTQVAGLIHGVLAFP